LTKTACIHVDGDRLLSLFIDLKDGFFKAIA